MKKLMMFAAIVAAFVSCQSNNKKNVETTDADFAPITSPFV